MTIQKICALIIFYFISRVALAADCETITGLNIKESVCWNDAVKAFVSESCNKNEKCEALQILKSKKKVQVPTPKGGQNPASLVCHALKETVLILRDKEGNEQSYCQFKDKTVIDVNALESHLR